MLLNTFDNILLIQITYPRCGSQTCRVINVVTTAMITEKTIGDIALKFDIHVKQVRSHRIDYNQKIWVQTNKMAIF